MTSFTMHTLSNQPSWWHYHNAYLKWMQSSDSPILRESNYNAETWKLRNLNQTIPVLEVPQIYDWYGA